jgi:hypothetical protein
VPLPPGGGGAFGGGGPIFFFQRGPFKTRDKPLTSVSSTNTKWSDETRASFSTLFLPRSCTLASITLPKSLRLWVPCLT